MYREKMKAEHGVMIVAILGAIMVVFLLNLVLDKPKSFYESCQPSNDDIQTKRYC